MKSTPKVKRWYYLWSPTKGCFFDGEFSKARRPDLFKSAEQATHWKKVQQSFHVVFPADTIICAFDEGATKVTSDAVEILRRQAERDPKLKRAVAQERKLQAGVCACGHARKHHDGADNTACWFGATGAEPTICACKKFRKLPKRKICVIRDCNENRVGDSMWCLTHRTRKYEDYMYEDYEWKR